MLFDVKGQVKNPAMKKKNTCLMKSIGLCLLLVLSSIAHGQIAVDSAYANNIQVCLKSEKVVVQVSVGSGTTGSYLETKLPVGFEFENVVSATNSNGGTVIYAGLMGGWHRFNISATTNISIVKVIFNQFANCQAGVSSFTTQDSFRFFNGVTTNTFAGLAFNGSAPDLSITSITNTPSPVDVGATITRKFTVTNGGFGASSRFLIADKYTPGELTYDINSFRINPSGVNFTIPPSHISIGTDSVKINFDTTLIKQTSNGDTLLSNGETFEIQYDMVPNSCGNSNVIQSTLLAGWQCRNGAICNWYNVNTGMSIAIPGVPDVSLIRRLNRMESCFNGTSYGDTVWIKNSGAGPATELNFDVFTMGYPNVARNDYYGSIDTSFFKYKIGVNGTEMKPVMTGTSVSIVNSLTCDLRGNLTRVTFQIPILGASDTLILMTGMSVCNLQYSCGAEETHLHQPGLPGVGYKLDYKNGCKNVTYDGGTKYVILSRSNPNHQGQNFAPANATASTVANFRQSLLSIPRSNLITTRAYHEITITIPPVLKLDSSLFGVGTFPVTISQNNGTIVQPYAQTGPYSFRFRHTDLGSVSGGASALNINLKGFCDTNYCPGIVFWGYDWKVNPDSANCTNENRFVCNSYPIAWNSNCKPDCCPAGMVNLEFTTNRISYGSPDNNDDKQPDATGSIDLTKIAVDQMVAGDTIEYYHKFYIKTNATHTSWENLYDNFLLPSRATRWEMISDSVFLDRMVGTDSIFAVTPVASGDNWVTDLSSLTDFQSGDTVIVRMKLRLLHNYDGSFNTRVNGYVSHVANPAAIDRYACGPIIDKMTVWSTRSFFHNVATLVSDGCAQLSLNTQFYCNTGPYGYANINHFPFEYRNFSIPTIGLQVIPKGYVVDSVELSVTAYSGTTLPSAYAGLNIPFTFVDDTLRYDVSSYFIPNGGLILPTDEGGYLQVRQYISPSCKVEPTIAQPVYGQGGYQTFNLGHSVSYPVGSTSYRTGVTLQNNQPFFLTNSAVPIAPAYEKIVSWPFTHSNTSSVSVPNNWLYFNSQSGLINIDSVKNGGTVITPDANGFYQLGTINGGQTVNLDIFSTQNACVYDSIQVYVGYGCKGYPTSFSDTTCSYPARYLYIQPQPAAIQTQITSLSVTPIDPANPGSGNYGKNTVDMCQSFPFEMEIQSTQTGNIFTVQERLILPTNFGNVGLDYVPDSGYIEYPIGTAPRKFGWRADSAILATVSGGQMLLDLNLIDSVNFDTENGLKGTALGNNTTRRAFLRWKMKPNCNMVSGDQWTAQQFALSPCGDTANNNSNYTSGFPLDITGISKPYVASVVVESSPDACGPFTTSILIQKIGTTASLPNDSVFIRLPHTVTNGNISCLGVNCAGGNVTYDTDSFAAYKILKFPFPPGLTTGDTLRYEFPTQSRSKANCEQNQELRADVFQRVSVLCGATPCPNSVVSLGNGTVTFDLEKPDLNIINYDAANNYPYQAPYKYLYWGEIMNSATVATGTNLVLKTYFDKNQNGMYDKVGDSFIKSTIIPGPIVGGGMVSFADSFTSMTAKPSPTRPLYTVIDTGDGTNNCFCSGVAPSLFLNALPVELLYLNAEILNNELGRVYWSTASESNAFRFDIYRSTDGISFIKVGEQRAQGTTSSATRYEFLDDLKNVSSGKIYYKLKQIDLNGTSDWTEVVEITKTIISSRVQVYPNPAEYVITLSVNDFADGLYNLNIVDIQGKIVQQIPVQVINGKAKELINISRLPKGVYHLVGLETAIKISVKR